MRPFPVAFPLVLVFEFDVLVARALESAAGAYFFVFFWLLFDLASRRRTPESSPDALLISPSSTAC